MKFKQINLPYIGGFRYLAARSIFYMTIVSIFFTSTAAYEQLRIWLPWINYWMIAGTVVIIYLLVMLIEHTFIFKSEINYTATAAFGPHNPMYVLLKDMEKEIKELKKEVQQLKSN